LAQLLQTYPAGTPERKYLTDVVSKQHKELVVSSSVGDHVSNKEFLDEFNKNVEEAKKDKDPENTQFLEDLKAALEEITQPEEQRQLTIIDLLGKADLDDKRELQLLSFFEDQSDPEELLNDVMNPHPIAAKLWGDRVKDLARNNIEYTRHFEEGTESTWRDINDNPKYQRAFERTQLDSNTPSHPPYSNALEEIFHMKLIRLATEYLHFDLNTDWGIAQFDAFCHEFDISPGEDTLERCHPYPPPHHTYDELPIMKYDGYSEVKISDDEAENPPMAPTQATEKTHGKTHENKH